MIFIPKPLHSDKLVVSGAETYLLTVFRPSAVRHAAVPVTGCKALLSTGACIEVLGFFSTCVGVVLLLLLARRRFRLAAGGLRLLLRLRRRGFRLLLLLRRRRLHAGAGLRLLHHIDNVITKIKSSGQEVPAEVTVNRAFIEGTL